MGLGLVLSGLSVTEGQFGTRLARHVHQTR